MMSVMICKASSLNDVVAVGDELGPAVGGTLAMAVDGLATAGAN